MENQEACFYCEEPMNGKHLEGCPYGIYDDLEGKVNQDSAYNKAVQQFEAGFEDGQKIYPSKNPSDPSFRLGQKRGIAEVTPPEQEEDYYF